MFEPGVADSGHRNQELASKIHEIPSFCCLTPTMPPRPPPRKGRIGTGPPAVRQNCRKSLEMTAT